ncbi:hypothetical protein CLI85_04280 [Tannerella forsythia]|nr:hypothetical protein Tanf_11145 [Tannerella forsythia]OLQ19932.1 hypothetical protein BGK60_02405 [Tannerella forsythia]PDP71429.1 hypothetical protein CLI85_04280 [Tannerella forsythia]
MLSDSVFARRQSLFCQSESYFLTLDSHYSYINKDRSVILYEIECNNSEKRGLYYLLKFQKKTELIFS